MPAGDTLRPEKRFGGFDEGVLMVKTPKGKEADVDLRPDGWQQFERAVDAAVKSGPKHKPAPAPKRVTGKGRARVGKSKA